MPLQEYAQRIEQYISDNLIDKYSERIKRLSEYNQIYHHLQQLANRSKEYHNPTFVALVVGPVKSGKSTFVNLVAKKYVSPTHFLECTVRPSIIRSGKNNTLTVYRSKDIMHKEEQINGILDCLNGLTEGENIKDVTKQEYECTKYTIDKYIRLDNIHRTEDDDILLTSIETEGGKLLQDNVCLVDMAGFDGANANFESPAYKAVVERADLIIFVQSSNSAISKVSSKFFELLKERNMSVPVCLVHNIFESAFWRDKEKQINDIELQKEYAIEQIQTKHGLMLKENSSFNLNLGKVADLYENNYEIENKGILKEEAAKFENAEIAINKLFKERESIRLANCISRTKLQRDRLLEVLNNAVTQNNNIKSEYERMVNTFNNLKEYKINDEFTVSISSSELKQIVKEEYEKFKNILGAGDNQEYKTEEARKHVCTLLENIKREITKLVNSRCKDLASIASCQDVQTWISDIINKTSEYISGQSVSINATININAISVDMEIDVDTNIDIDIETLVPHRRLWYKHSWDDLNSYLTIIRDAYCGFMSSAGVDVKGNIDNSIYNNILSIIKDFKSSVLENIESYIVSQIDSIQELAQSKMIPNYNEFAYKVQLIIDLREQVKKFNIEMQ